MGRIAYVNGQYVPHARACVHIEDRGYQFADGIYEVCGVRGGKLMDLEGHLRRFARSLAEVRIAPPVPERGLRFILAEVVRRNHIRHGLVYIQVTRGVATRDHYFPEGATSALVVTAKAGRPALAEGVKGIGVMTLPDNRWGRCDIKTVGLLPNILAKEAAKAAGADDAWFVDRDGYVTEAAAANVWIVTADDTLVTRPLGPEILGGITRETLLDIARREHLKVEERRFTVAEAQAAKEAFVSSAGKLIVPVVKIDGRSVRNGEAGDLTLRLRRAYLSLYGV